jgi:lipopolysaccharide/colanic/teichoic acid biosynthesis glycosyltransferase
MTAACPSAVVVMTTEGLAKALSAATFSDVVLFVDPRCLPMSETAFGLLGGPLSVRQVAQHLVACEPSIAGTKEHLNVDDQGQVQNVHRYYERLNWPFVSGVAATAVPVSGSIISFERIPSSLVEFRQQLMSRGMSSRDVLLEGGAFDLTKEHGLLAAMEQSVLDLTHAARVTGRNATLRLGGGHSIDPTARLLGPVVIHPNVRIEAHATIVGPALIGEGSHVSAGAVVAHALLGTQSRVLRGTVVRDRVWSAGVEEDACDVVESPLPPRAQMARFTVQSYEGPGRTLDEVPNRYLAWKRVFDAALAAVALIVLSPLFAIVSVLVWLESRGPVFFTDEREGARGQSFRCLKFRTMWNGTNERQHELRNSNHADGPHFKVLADPRTTRVGRLLRATNVDELPQLVNVLLGEMSLVGPRPSPFHENQICVPWRQGRLSVPPGITGLWQLCRRDRASGDFHQWIEYDLLYVQHMSMRLDLMVLAATCLTLGGKIEMPIAPMLRIMVGRVPPPLNPRTSAEGPLTRRHAQRVLKTLKRSLGHG